MNLTSWALSRNRVIAGLLLLLAAMGIFSYLGMPRDDMPPYTIRFASIVTQFPGAGPERVEELITSPLEEVAQELSEIKSITSESRTGLSVIAVEVRQDIPQEDLQLVWDRLRRKVDNKAATLPGGASHPDLKDDGLGVVYGIIVGLQNDGFTNDEMEDFAEYLRDRILNLKDASDVEMAGIQQAQVYVDYNPTKLAKLGLTAGALRSTLASTNILYPGGSVVLGDERVILEPSGNFASLEELKATIVPLPSGGTVALRDIADVTRRHINPPRVLTRINGKPGLTLSIAVRKEANLIRLGQEVDALLHKETENLPVGVELFRVADQDHVVEKSIDDFIGNLFQSVGVVFFVMLFMLGLRTGAVVATLIPMTMLLTLFFMGSMGQGLNQVTLAALIMALGMLVDNAIVMSEAILVGMESGQAPKDAAVSASTELAFPLFISSLTTSAAFLAFFLAESLMGEIVGPLFVVISIALLSSWFLSLTLIPVLVVAVVRPAKEKKESVIMAAIGKAYSKTLGFCLRQRVLVLVATIAVFFGTMTSAGSLPFIFFPDSERALVQVDLNLPLGSRIEATDKVVAKLETYIRTELSKDVVDLTSFIGEGPSSYDLGYQPGEGNSGYAHILVNTASGDLNDEVIHKINSFGIEQLPNAEVKARRLAGGGGGVPIELRISGRSPEALYDIGARAKKFLLTTPGSASVGDNWGPRIKKFSVNIRQRELRKAGLTNEDVAVGLQTVLTGFTTGEFREDDSSIPITMRGSGATEFQIEDIENISILGSRGGKSVPLSQVAEVGIDWQFPRIRRRNRIRTFSVTSYLQEGFTANDVTAPLVTFLEEDKKSWPDGFSYELGGEAEQSEEGMASVGEKLPLGFGIIIMLLIFQFNSFRKTAIVLSTVPLGLVGVILGLHLFRSYFGFFAFLGMISLAGIVINNAIVLIDRIRIEIEENNKSPHDAIMDACGHRLRPILLTTLTTTLGLIPLYLGGGLMWEPMAVAIMIGLLFATLITLVFVPVLYSLLFRSRAHSA